LVRTNERRLAFCARRLSFCRARFRACGELANVILQRGRKRERRIFREAPLSVNGNIDTEGLLTGKKSDSNELSAFFADGSIFGPKVLFGSRGLVTSPDRSKSSQLPPLKPLDWLYPI